MNSKELYADVSRLLIQTVMVRYDWDKYRFTRKSIYFIIERGGSHMTQDYASSYRYDNYKKDKIRNTPIAFQVLDRIYTFIVV